MMRRRDIYATGLLLLLGPLTAGTADPPKEDPLDAVVAAIHQGRHWYATRLLRDLKPGNTPQTTLLAARADAGRGAWPSVIQRLDGAPWLDSASYGAGRALVARAWFEVAQYERAAESYRIFLSYSVERMPRALAEVGLARALAASDRPREGAAAYARAATLIPEIAPWLFARAAEVMAPTGDTAAVVAWLERASGIDARRRVLAAASAYERAGDPEAALMLYLNAADAPATREHSADFKADAARILLVDGDTAGARGVLRSALRAGRGSKLPAARLLARLPELQADDHLALARAFQRSHAWAEAAEHSQEHLRLAKPSRTERQRLELEIGELLFRARSYFAAIETLDQLLATDPPASIRAPAEYYYARATYRRGWRAEGRRRLRQLADDHPGTGSALRALSLLSALYESAGDNARTSEIYERLVRDYPRSRSARGARFKLGILAYLDGDYAAAWRHFDRLRRGGRPAEERVAALYWAARARLADGSAEQRELAERLLREAQRRAPFSYHGLLAAERLGIDPWEDLPDGPAPAELDKSLAERLNVLDLLREAGLDEEAEGMLDHIVADPPRDPEELLGLSRDLAERGFGSQAVRLGWLAHLRSDGRWSESVLKAIYPIAFADIIIAEARSRQLEPYLVAAIARQESAFEPDVVSRAGARGLLQIMPRTGRWWATRVGIRDYSDDLLFHPEINVHLGAAYFADLQRRYRELQLSLIAYNAGPTRAQRWSQQPAYQVDPELFAELIPFSETRTYVRNVQTQLRIYRQLYRETWLDAGAD